MRISNLAFSLALLLCFAGTALGQADQMSDGIRVNGHWEIKVVNPDGTVDQHIEFENGLVNAATLTGFLRGDLAAGGTFVLIGNSQVTSGPCNNSSCNIAPSGLDIGVTPESSNLTSQYFTVGNFLDGGLRLSGSVTATTAATIDLVQTWVTVCGSKKPSDCKLGSDSSGVFTSKTLSSGVSVTVGQIVQVTVEITFS